MLIDRFVPPKIPFKALNLVELNAKCGKNFCYAAKGCIALSNIILSFPSIKSILVPVFICDSVINSIEKLKIKISFYDYESSDLNASIESISTLVNKEKPDALLVASMYGNPANLEEIENYCKKNSIIMIDDAAQSFGALLNNRYVGTFGDAGFFSFSPGKSTTAHMGAFFWTNGSINIPRRENYLVHKIVYYDYIYNRHYHNFIIKNTLSKFFSAIKRAALKLSTLRNDSISKFEERILGGVLYCIFSNEYKYRTKYITRFNEKFRVNKFFIPITSIRGNSVQHKFVLKFFDQDISNKFIIFLKTKNIYSQYGYLITKTFDEIHTPNVFNDQKKIVEIPIENDELKMDYLFRCVKEFCSNE